MKEPIKLNNACNLAITIVFVQLYGILVVGDLRWSRRLLGVN